MALNQGSKVSTSYEGAGYAFDKVVFQGGKPILDSELNLAQELQEVLTQKSTAHLPSGWLSYRPFYTSSDLSNSFYTQDPDGAKPEVALVNGWPVYVTNTDTELRHVNKIQLNDAELRSGSRVDGVFLEVWRSTIIPQQEEITTTPASNEIVKPTPDTKISDLNGVWMYDENIGWAVGNNGTILKTVDGGVNWISIDTPVKANFNKVRFFDLLVGYAVADKGYIVKSIDGGSSWVELDTPITDDLYDLHIINDQRACVVGANGTVLLTIDAENFEIVNQTQGTTEDLNSVTFYDTSVGWAVGNSGVLLMTKDGGNIWERFNLTLAVTSTSVTDDLSSVAFYNLNDGIVVGKSGKIYRTSDSGFTWSNVSDRIWYNGAYKSISEIYPASTIDFNQVFIREQFPIKFTIGVYPDSKNFFKNLVYRISPSAYPNSLVLEYTGTQDNLNYLNVLDLDQYDTAEDLKDAINEIMSPYRSDDAQLPNESRQKVRVFEAVIEHQPFSRPSDFRPSSGSFSSLAPAQISFSVEDKAWIAGDSGVALVSSNSGSKWELVDLGVGYDLQGIDFVNNNLGWYVGTNGSIVNYDSQGTTDISVQSTDLVVKTKGRIFPEGNILSDAEDYLPDNIIDPDVNVETTRRVQIQYRVRIMDGVDPFNNPEAGLGHSFVYSLGPNANSDAAGRYTYTNMGDENGDYGLWRARCRNTYDGYSWAVPMFFVMRRNSGAFDVDSNINGSTYFDQNAVRPDGLTYERIVENDVTDIRRQINIQSYSHLLQKNVENLLSNDLKTHISDKDQKGLQYGTSIMMVDQYTGENEIANLVEGGVSSAAVIVEDQKLLDPNIQITEAELTFGPIDNGLYHNDPAYYEAYVVRDSVVTNEPVDGEFEGLGTNRVIFHIADNFTPAGGDLEGVEYQITAHYLDYSREGLSRVPQEPIAVKYQSDPIDINESLYFNGVSGHKTSRVLETLTENVVGYKDYVSLYAAKNIPDNTDDQELYELLLHTASTDSDYQKSLRTFSAQQYRGSLVEYHHYMKVESATNILRIPKNINGYSVFGVRSIKNVLDEASYKIAVDFQDDQSIRDREMVDGTDVISNLVVYIDPAFTIPADAVVEVVLEVSVPAEAMGVPNLPLIPGYTLGDTQKGLNAGLGMTTRNKGEYQEGLRTSFSSDYGVASRAVSGMYVGILYPTIPGSVVEVDLTNPTIPSLENATALGIISGETKETTTQSYLWYKSNEPDKDYYTMVPISSVEGMGTSNLTITIDPRRVLNEGTVLVPLLVKLADLPGLVDTSTATVFYRFIPYQTVGNLPSSLKFEVMNMPETVYITNLGTGASENVFGRPYVVPAEHIPVNDDDFKNDNIFSNVDDLDFSNFSVDTGFIKMPAIISQFVGEDMTLSDVNNIGDKLGRSFYETSSVDLYSQAENLTLGTPRKVFVPMIARVRTKLTYPFLRGELVLIIFSKTYKARIDNRAGYFEDTDIEYAPGYIEYADPSISIYKLKNRPLVRK